MDNITHGLAGLLMADVALQSMSPRHGRTLSPRVRRATVLLGVIAAEFPDSDLVYSGPLVGMGQLGYLLHHRGHTHTLVWATVSAIALWLIARWWVKRGDAVDKVSAGWPLLVLAIAGTWSHLLLDWTNSYGVHPFWPFDNRWYYGDAVFIVEPWLWLIAIPPLLWGNRSLGGRIVLSLLGIVILVAAGFTGQVIRNVAIVLAVFAALWMAAQWVIRPRARVWGGIALWVAATMVFALSSRAVRAAVTQSVAQTGDTVLDVVLNPAPGDPTCWTPLIASRSADGQMYRLTTATASVLGVRGAAACQRDYHRGANDPDLLDGLDSVSHTVPYRSSTTVAWSATWQTPVASLKELTRARCEVAAAFRFMRTPAWRTEADGTLSLVDARYGTRGGFNALSYPAAKMTCSLVGKWIPPWTPPRSDLLQ